MIGHLWLIMNPKINDSVLSVSGDHQANQTLQDKNVLETKWNL